MTPDSNQREKTRCQCSWKQRRPMPSTVPNLKMFGLAIILAVVVSGCGNGSADDPPSSGSSSEARQIKGDFKYVEGWCEDFDFSEPGETLGVMDADDFDIDDSSYSGDAEGFVDIDNRLSSVCAGGHRQLPLELNFETMTQVYVSSEVAKKSLDDSGRWPIRKQLSTDQAAEAVGKVGNGFLDTYAAKSDEKSDVRMLVQHSNMIFGIDLKYCGRIYEDKPSEPCSESELRDFVIEFAEHAQRLHEV